MHQISFEISCDVLFALLSYAKKCCQNLDTNAVKICPSFFSQIEINATKMLPNFQFSQCYNIISTVYCHFPKMMPFKSIPFHISLKKSVFSLVHANSFGRHSGSKFEQKKLHNTERKEQQKNVLCMPNAQPYVCPGFPLASATFSPPTEPNSSEIFRAISSPGSSSPPPCLAAAPWRSPASSSCSPAQEEEEESFRMKSSKIQL